MSALRRPLLFAFAGGCLSGAALILSGIGVISIWHGALTVSPSPHGARERSNEGAALHVAAADAPRERLRPAPVASIDSDELGPEPAAAHASDEAVVEHPAESGSSVADVLTRLEAAYRQGLVDGAHANADQGALPNGTESLPGATEILPAGAPSTPHDVVAHDAIVATADTTSPAPAATAPPAVVAPMQAAVVGVPVQPIVVALAAPPVAPDAYPAQAAEAGASPGFTAQDPAGSHEGYGSVTQNIHVDNLHQGDVYNQVQVMQYMQLLAGSPYGNYAGYVPAPAVPAHHHNGSATSTSPFSTPPLPVAAPPFPSWYSSVTNPANPFGYQRRSGRAFR